MLIGSFEHMLDAKGRVFIPAKWRESVGDTLDRHHRPARIFRMSRAFLACPLEEWERFSQKLSTLPVTDAMGQAIRRRLYSQWLPPAKSTSRGASCIPAQLREMTGLTKDATLIGVGERVEIWNPETLAAYSAVCDENYGDAMAHLAAQGI